MGCGRQRLQLAAIQVEGTEVSFHSEKEIGSEGSDGPATRGLRCARFRASILCASVKMLDSEPSAWRSSLAVERHGHKVPQCMRSNQLSWEQDHSRSIGPLAAGRTYHGNESVAGRHIEEVVYFVGVENAHGGAAGPTLDGMHDLAVCRLLRSRGIHATILNEHGAVLRLVLGMLLFQTFKTQGQTRGARVIGHRRQQKSE